MSKVEYTDYLIQKIAATGEEHALEVAAGTCICGRALAPYVKDITCLDMTEEMLAQGYIEEWICYKCESVSAKRLTVLPGQTVTIRDGAPYGLICLEGHGRFGAWEIESPALIRYGELTHDEYFVTEKAALEGITITNPSDTDPIVILKHFSDNPDLKLYQNLSEK